ncbi:hypothetical protein N9W89_01755 [Hellea sp.]|nr:hypothetical protein [Hellea sp.]
MASKTSQKAVTSVVSETKQRRQLSHGLRREKNFRTNKKRVIYSFDEFVMCDDFKASIELLNHQVAKLDELVAKQARENDRLLARASALHNEYTRDEQQSLFSIYG